MMDREDDFVIPRTTSLKAEVLLSYVRPATVFALAQISR
jgi:hypothetical protein